MKRIALDKITTDGGTQPRAGLDMEAVNAYAEAYSEGVKMPPLVVFSDGSTYWLADGFHRYHAAMQLEFAEIECDVKKGTVRDAILYAVGANHQHGIRRTNADKRRAVEMLLADEEWAKWSDRKIAETCGVGNALASEVRAQLFESNSSDQPATIGRDGKARKRPKRRSAYERMHKDPVDFDPNAIVCLDEQPPKHQPKRPPTTNVIGELWSGIEAFLTDALRGVPASTRTVIADKLEGFAAELRG